MIQRREQLRRELKAAGADPQEIEGLSELADDLKLLKTRPEKATDSRLNRPVLYLGFGFAAILALIVFSRSALPSSWLYPIQKVSDDAIIEIDPSYRENVMMKRAHQVNQLVASHAAESQIIATLSDYTQQANIYKDSSHANYSAFEYCENNLKQAMAKASPIIRSDIAHSLYSVETS